MSEVLKKLNLGDASSHLIKYMGKQYKPQGYKSKEDESIKKLRNCKQMVYRSPSLLDTEESPAFLTGHPPTRSQLPAEDPGERT